MHVPLLAALLALAPGSRSQEESREDDSKTLEAVPADAMIALSIGPLDELRARAKDNAWFRMAKDEEFAPFFAKIGDFLDRAFAEGLAEESEADRRILDPRAWLEAVHGSLSTFILTSPPYSESEVVVGVLIDARGDKGELDQLLDGAIEMLRRESSESGLDHGDTEISLFEGSEDPASFTIYFETAGVCAFLGGDRRDALIELAQGTIDRLSGEDPAGGLASSERLSEARAASGPARAIEFYMDVGKLIRVVEAEERAEAALIAGTEVTEPEPDPIFERLGLYDIRWLHWGADIGAGENADFHMALHLPEQSLLHQASRFLGPAPRDLFALAPSDCLAAQVGNVDVPRLWEFVVRTVEEFAPENHETFSAGLEQAKVGMGIDVEGDLIEQISGDFMSFTMRVPSEEIANALQQVQGSGGSEEGSHVAFEFGYAYLIALEDGVVVEDFFERVLEIGSLTPLIEFQEFQGHHLQSLGVFPLHWCFLDEYLAVAGTPTPLRTALTRLGAEDAPSILSEERYRSALARHPDASLLHVGDSRAMVEAWLGMLEEAFGGIPPIELEGADVDLASELLPLLPDPARLRKYLSGVSTNALEVGTESLRLTMRAR